jgi:hypothetical protein
MSTSNDARDDYADVQSADTGKMFAAVLKCLRCGALADGVKHWEHSRVAAAVFACRQCGRQTKIEGFALERILVLATVDRSRRPTLAILPAEDDNAAVSVIQSEPVNFILRARKLVAALAELFQPEQHTRTTVASAPAPDSPDPEKPERIL